jgi:hypothetical protein
MTVATAGANLERLADHYAVYLFKHYGQSRHVRRVVIWIGFVLKSIERVAGGSIQISRTRQLTFSYSGCRFKVRYSHQAGPRGGIQIVRVLPGAGSPEGGLVVNISSLDDAEGVYRSLKQDLDTFLANPQGVTP